MRAFILITLVFACAVIAGRPLAHTKERWVSLFNGKDLAGWHLRDPQGPNGWKVRNGVYVNTPPSTDIQTNAEYYDFQLHVEFRVSDGDGNSGVYMRDKSDMLLKRALSGKENAA